MACGAARPAEDAVALVKEDHYRDLIASHDPVLLSELLLRSPEALSQGSALQGQAVRFVEGRQPQAGLAWAARIPQAAYRSKAVESLFSRWLEADRPAAESAALSLADPAARAAAMLAIAKPKEPEAAWAWAQQMAGPGRAEAMATAIEQLGSDTPTPDAARRLAELRAAGSSVDLTNATEVVAGNWAMAYPPAAAGWAARLPAGNQPAAYSKIAGLWADRDPAAASEWLAQPLRRDHLGRVDK